MIKEALRHIQYMFNELKRQEQQLPITMFFHKIERKKRCPLSKNLSHHHHYHLRLTSSSHHYYYITGYVQVGKYDFHCKVCNNNTVFHCLCNALMGKHYFYCLCSAVMEKHNFYFSVSP